MPQPRHDAEEASFRAPGSGRRWHVTRTDGGRSVRFREAGAAPGAASFAAPASLLREECPCPVCRDPSSGQKNFSSTEIPLTIRVGRVRATVDGLAVTFAGDVPRLSRDGAHEALLPYAFLEDRLRPGRPTDLLAPSVPPTGVLHWDRDTLERHASRIDFAAYAHTDDALWDAVVALNRTGIVFLSDVPRDHDAVVRIASRIASIKETFYGRTFDVRAKPDAENVAYTSAYLGLHQDLLYLHDMPRIQILHCLDNSCPGGDSLFSDADRVARLLLLFHGASGPVRELLRTAVPYAYTKHGYAYHGSHRVIDCDDDHGGAFRQVFWSPPFQGHWHWPALADDPARFHGWLAEAQVFERLINADDAVYQYRMRPGDCVLFDNRRVMHGRRAFDLHGGGSRWLRGTYIAHEDFQSRSAHIPAQVLDRVPVPRITDEMGLRRQLLASPWLHQVVRELRTIQPDLQAPPP